MEDVSTIEEVRTPVATLDSALCQKLLDLTAPNVSLARTGAKSTFMEQMLLLVKIDVRRLMKKTETHVIVARMNANIVDV